MKTETVLVALALMAATCAAQASTCAVSNPRGGMHGNQSLAAVLPENGTFLFKPGGPGFVDSDGALGIKVGWALHKKGTLSVRGHRLDEAAQPARAYIPRSYDNYTGGMSLFLVFLTPGCWEITGTVAGASLTFVVDVQKIGDGPASHMQGPPSGSRVTS